MTQTRAIGRNLIFAGLLCTLGLGATSFAAEADKGFTIGSHNVAVADPAVPRPAGKPCVVVLFRDATFANFNPRPYSYEPPKGCGYGSHNSGNTSWAKVVLEADFSVTAGRQYDRTASLWLGGVNLYFGTTQEPSSTVAPSWHVERDLTDYSAFLRAGRKGQAVIGNVVNATYTGVIHGSARLLFYPSTGHNSVPTADAVYPLGADPIGSTTTLNSSTDKLAKTLTLPRNVERVFLDVFAQSQGNDEFWYTCVPDQYASEVNECGGGNFREAEISIDGQPAGIAPIYPWIYTGGIDPFLWEPTPGVQTLNFMPYRVDLTPFAGLLSNGASHEVAVSVAGANNSFSATAALLVYRDKQRKQVTGQITRNTLVGQAATPTIGSTLTNDGKGNINGDITTELTRQFIIEGYADTSRGRVYTLVNHAVTFDNTQSFVIDASTYRQTTQQLTTSNSTTARRIGNQQLGQSREHVDYPLYVDYNQQAAADGSSTAATNVLLNYNQTTGLDDANGKTLYEANVHNDVTAGDTLAFDKNGNYTGHSGQNSNQSFDFGDSLGSCYQTNVTSANGALSAFSAGQGCPNGQNHVLWFAHPDGSPYTL